MQSKTLREADKIIHGERQDQYGKPEFSFLKVAGFWNAYIRNKRSFTCNLNEKDVALMMTLFKIAREQGTGHKEDNAIDACGYLAIYNDRLFGCNPPERKAIYPAFFSDLEHPTELVELELENRIYAV